MQLKRPNLLQRSIHAFYSLFLTLARIHVSLLIIPLFITIHPFLCLLTGFGSRLMFKGGFILQPRAALCYSARRTSQVLSSRSRLEFALKELQSSLAADYMLLKCIFTELEAHILQCFSHKESLLSLTKWGYLHNYYGSKTRTGVSIVISVMYIT